MRYDCLQPKNRLIANRPLFSSGCCDGLVIDDFFAISVLPGNYPLQDCFASRRHCQASAAYAKEDLLGSPLKDVVGSDCAKVIGGVLNSSAQARSQGVATLASPIEKRLSLSWILLQVAQLSHTTDSLHVCLMGGVVSAFLFRRPLMSLLSRSFSLVNASEVNELKPRLVALPRAVCDELVLVAVLLPLALSDLSAEFSLRFLQRIRLRIKAPLFRVMLADGCPSIFSSRAKAKEPILGLNSPRTRL